MRVNRAWLYILIYLNDKCPAALEFLKTGKTGNHVTITDSDPASRPIQTASLADKTSGAFLWMISQTLGSKLITAVAQLVLAWKLDRKDFGLVGLAYTVAAFATILQRSGLEDILIQRQKTFRRWANATFWMALLSGCLAALAMVAAAPIAMRFFHAPALFSLILILAISSPLTSLSIVPSAKLQIEFRFRAISLINFVSGTLGSVLSIILAWSGFGVFSFVIPQPIAALTRTVVMWLVAQPNISGHAHFRRWRFLAGDSAFLLGTAVCNAVMGNGDYLVLGITKPKEVVGSYFFAFNLSTQMLATVTVTLATTLYPALSSLQENSQRLKAAYIRASRAINSLAAPACVLQAAIAGPLLRFLFGTKWISAIPSLRILSIGMAFSTLGGVSASMIQAQGRFKLFFQWSIAISVAFLLFVTIGAHLGGAAAVATAVTLFYAIFSPIGFYISIRPLGGLIYDVLLACFVPIILGATAVALPLAISMCLPETHLFDAISILFIAATSLIIYIAILKFFWPMEYREIKARLVSLRNKFLVGDR
jgi:O-antigen/teichoic acid export membrane protein